MNQKISRWLFAIVSYLPFSSFARAADQYPITYERNVAVKMRDGVTLRADIYRPTADGKFPVLLQRTPYDKNQAVRIPRRSWSRRYRGCSRRRNCAGCSLIARKPPGPELPELPGLMGLQPAHG